MTTNQKLLGWIALVGFVLSIILDEFHFKGVHPDIRTMLPYITFGCFFFWLAYFLKSMGKDGFSVLIIPAVVIIADAFPNLREGVANICGFLMEMGLMLGGFFAATEAAKRAKNYPVLAFSVVLIAWYAGVMGLMQIISSSASDH